jgi:hypothetical protein
VVFIFLSKFIEFYRKFIDKLSEFIDFIDKFFFDKWTPSNPAALSTQSFPMILTGPSAFENNARVRTQNKNR